MNIHLTRKRAAFTLVEILTVIIIIGILAGIAIPAVTGALRTAREAAIRLNIDVVGQGLEAYKLKYGSYPPDFSDWNKVERHFRKAFPNIDDSELMLLAQYTHLDSSYQRVPLTSGNVDPRAAAGYQYYRQCMDPAEALVFCLGGYSSNVRRPFTGEGGPLSPISSPDPGVTADYGLYQYNSARENGFMDVSEGLSIAVINSGTGSPNPANAGSAYTFSNDEYAATIPTADLQSGFTTRAPAGNPFAAIHYLADPFPVYSSNSDSGPLVYFASDNYTDTFAPATVTGGWMGGTGAGDFHSLNIYLHPGNDISLGVARPYLTDQLDTNSGGFLWAEPGKYQLISAGLDGSYGGTVAAGTGTAAGVVTRYASGSFANSAGSNPTGGDKYEDPESVYGAEKPQLDNITNFSTRTLESDLP
ncbi:Type II secretion system protein G precursor [Rubripirellula lacrimiformis]|uniref:Type II secretion system protein G n=1 Tax=Rubripirellula lacrimiformis TaxID=1930273 RepID=A0A517NFV4_9BACT|nr:prepilin-type N-terminal cleavage/methylation domain-containing protein [Rubripirellula lacrimiformis]QDT06026.1 Type II secretion system protein G precursor [Rubripirellula lacrimiformis]